MMPASDVTIAITAVAATTLYYVDHNSWGNANAYMWNDSGNNGWPGVAMTSVGTVGENNYAYYSVSFAQGAYTSIIFSNNGNNQTADQTIDPAKPYFYDGAWYTWDELLAKLAAPVVTYDYYICGSFNSNNPKNAENGMTLVGDVYKATVTLAEGDNTLKVTDGSWDNTWGYSNLGAAYDEVSDANDYNNIKITLAAEAEKEITVIFDATAGKITFEGLTPYVAPLTYTVTVPAGTEKCYIAGNMNGWEFQEMEAVTGETNKFTITIVGAKETDEYKYACQADWAYAEVIDGGGNRTNWSELDEVTAWNKPVVYTYYLMGVNDDWATGIEMTENPDQEGEYMLTCQPVNGQVKIKRVGDDDSEYWFGGKSLKEDPANLGTNTEAATDGDGNIELAAGKYNFYFNTADGKLWIAAATDCTPAVTTIDVTLSGMVATPYSRMGSYRFLSLDDEDGNQISIFNGTEGAYGDDFEVNAYLAAYDVTVVGTGDWNVVDGVETLTATLQVEDDNTTIYNVTATVGVATTITLECYEATYTITDPEFNEVTFTGVADGKEFSILVSYFGGEYYSEGEWGETFIMGTEVEFDDSDAESYYLGGTYIDDASNTYEVVIFGAPAAVEPTPNYTRTVTAGNFGTICLPFGSTNYTGMELYEFVGCETGKAYLGSVTTLVAGVPYIFRATAGELAVYSDETTADEAGNHNGLYGTFTNDTEVAVGNYILKDNAICECTATCWVNANRAYIVWGEIPTGTPQQMPGRKYIGMDVTSENEATGLDNITNGKNTTLKLIENGQLIIIRDGEKFNAQGVRF